MAKRQERTRNYVAIAYPESMPDDWWERLAETHLDIVVSPLHDMDTDKNGELKKPHYHIMIMFDGMKTESQAQAVFDLVGAVKCQPVITKPGQARYLCHLDDPDKYLYSVEDVRVLGNIDYMEMIQTVKDRQSLVKEMLEFCRDNKIVAYNELMDYAMEKRNDWFSVLVSNGTYVVKEYLKALTWDLGKKSELRKLLDEKEKSEHEAEKKSL